MSEHLADWPRKFCPSSSFECLVDDPTDPFPLTTLFSRPEEGYEPGPYHIVEVWRRESGPS